MSLRSGVGDFGMYWRLPVDSLGLGGSGFGGRSVFGHDFHLSGLKGDQRDWESTCWVSSGDHCGYTKLGMTPSTDSLARRGAIWEHTLAAMRHPRTATISHENLPILALCYSCSFCMFLMRRARVSFSCLSALS